MFLRRYKYLSSGVLNSAIDFANLRISTNIYVSLSKKIKIVVSCQFSVVRNQGLGFRDQGLEMLYA